MTARVSRIERLLRLRSLLADAWDAAYAADDVDRGEQILDRIRAVSAEIAAVAS